jgi:hypothetical protein
MILEKIIALLSVFNSIAIIVVLIQYSKAKKSQEKL